MKKLILALSIGAMLMGFASMAAAEVTVGGGIDIRYDNWYNIDGLNNAAGNGHTQQFFTERVLLNVDAKIAEGLEAFVELDSINSEREWGFNNVGNGAVGGNVFGLIPSGTGVNYQGETMAIRQAWINFMVPGIPVGVKVGHQPLALGHGIFLDTHRFGTDAALIYAKPMPSLLIAGVYTKFTEPDTTFPGGAQLFKNSQDADAYAALANFTWMENNTVGINYTYIHDNNLLTKLAIPFAVNAHNIGVTADGTIGMLNYKADVEYITINGNGSTRVAVSQGWAGMLGVGAKVMNVANVNLEAAYGTGTSPSKNSASLFGSAFGTGFGGSRTYTNPYSSTSYNYAFLYNDKIGQGNLAGPFGGGGFGFGDGTGGFGLANTGYIKVSAGFTPTDKLKAGIDVLYLRASEKLINGQSNDLGWEIDANVGYKLYDNLSVDLTAGAFLPGAWYDTMSTLVGTGADVHAALGLETKLTAKF